MFYPVKVLTPEGQLKKTIPSKLLSEKAWEEVLKKPPLLHFGKRAEKKDGNLIRYWRQLNSMLDEFHGVN